MGPGSTDSTDWSQGYVFTGLTHVRSVHCQLIRLFARGIEDQPLFEDFCTPTVI
ncbi:hypothetical protein JZ751_024096 [Albula glossodonta]|uniref:Uncharacterized protein n=1 Tax=Albula glossodonta TaxID=121402 RepID=A0A8T2NNC7_9TELE|nr:hypothetical protein JZ751_024096 [Albula glossodonta]